MKRHIISLNPTPDELVRFWEHIECQSQDACWVPDRKPGHMGYCYFHFRGKNYFMHRLAYAWHYHVDPAALLVCHKCDNPPCCNPNHLFLGTNADNTRDALMKDRIARGSRRPDAKLTEIQVAQIHRMLIESVLDQQAIADIFGVSQGVITRISTGKSWKHVPRPDGRHKRNIRGLKHPSARLTEQQVMDIRRLYHEGVLTQQEIADQFGVTQTHIGGIVRGKGWTDLPTLPGRAKRRSGKLSGAANPQCKLTDDQVRQIYARANAGESYTALSAEFAVSKATICNIKKGKRWAHLLS